MDEFICETPFTINWLCDIVNKVGNGGKGGCTHLLKWDCRQIGVGEGTLSSIFKVTFEWNENQLKRPTSVVLKVD